jgi:hypothetical protein
MQHRAEHSSSCTPQTSVLNELGHSGQSAYPSLFTASGFARLSRSWTTTSD